MSKSGSAGPTKEDADSMARLMGMLQMSGVSSDSGCLNTFGIVSLTRNGADSSYFACHHQE